MNDPIQDAGASGVILGWVQVIKGLVPKSWARYLPVACVLLGEVYVWGFGDPAEPVLKKIVRGFVVGLTAAGVYAGTKATFEKKKKA